MGGGGGCIITWNRPRTTFCKTARYNYEGPLYHIKIFGLHICFHVTQKSTSVYCFAVVVCLFFSQKQKKTNISQSLCSQGSLVWESVKASSQSWRRGLWGRGGGGYLNEIWPQDNYFGVQFKKKTFGVGCT